MKPEEVILAVPDVAWGLGIGTILFSLGCGALWGALHLRGRVFARLKPQVELAQSGLAEKSMRLLRVLRDELNEVIPDNRKSFDPRGVIVDPSTVETAAHEGVRAIRQQAMLKSRFDALLDSCTALKPIAIAFPATVLAATATYFALFSMPIIWISLWVLTAALGLAGATALGIYARLNSLVEQSIEDASSDVKPGMS